MTTTKTASTATNAATTTTRTTTAKTTTKTTRTNTAKATTKTTTTTTAGEGKVNVKPDIEHNLTQHTALTLTMLLVNLFMTLAPAQSVTGRNSFCLIDHSLPLFIHLGLSNQLQLTENVQRIDG